MKPSPILLFSILLLAGCRQKAPAAEEKGGTTTTLKQASYKVASGLYPLATAAGKKEAYTQKELDSLQNINSLRKKF